MSQPPVHQQTSLTDYGWNDFFQNHFSEYLQRGFEPARVTLEHNYLYRVITARGEMIAEVAGKLRHEAASREQLPGAGDWTAVQIRPNETRATIHAVLPRRSRFVRKAAGDTTEVQVVGANIDTLFLVTSLNQDFNVRRIERYLAAAWDSGARPVILLSKADLCIDVSDKVACIEAAAPGVKVHALSAKHNSGMTALQDYLRYGETVALVGSSGVGKSTLINHLLGFEKQLVRGVRENDDRGQHTTTYRELILLPQGGLVLDTPGMRELQLWDSGQGLEAAFDDIIELATQCRFSDCQHQTEPECAIQSALDDGSLERARLENYLKLQAEQRHIELKQNQVAQRAEKQRWKKLTRQAQERARHKRK